MVENFITGTPKSEEAYVRLVEKLSRTDNSVSETHQSKAGTVPEPQSSNVFSPSELEYGKDLRTQTI